MGRNYFLERFKYRTKEEILEKVHEFERFIAAENAIIERNLNFKAIVIAAGHFKRRYEAERDFYRDRLPKNLKQAVSVEA